MHLESELYLHYYHFIHFVHHLSVGCPKASSNKTNIRTTHIVFSTYRIVSNRLGGKPSISSCINTHSHTQQYTHTTHTSIVCFLEGRAQEEQAEQCMKVKSGRPDTIFNTFLLVERCGRSMYGIVLPISTLHIDIMCAICVCALSR